MAASTQTFSMASSFSTGEGNITDPDEPFTPMYSAKFVDNFEEMNFEEMNFEFELNFGDIPWRDDWAWPHFGDTPKPKHFEEELIDSLPVAINLSQELAEEIAPGLGRDRAGSSVIAGSEESESTEEPTSTGEPVSSEKQVLPEKSESPESPGSPKEPESPEGSHSPEEPVSPESPEGSHSPEEPVSPEGSHSPESPGEPESTEGSHSPEEPVSPEGSHSPESPEEETARRLVQDEEFVARDEHETENLLNLRMKLHKGLLTKKGRKECQMSDMSSLLRRLKLHFEQLECVSYEERLEYMSREDVRAAKSTVLLRAINRQEGIPFELNELAASLLAKWKCIRRRRGKPVVKSSALQRKAGPTAPLLVNPTESYESSTNPGTPSFQGSDDGNDGVAVNPAWNTVGIDLTESCKPVAISETPSSQAMVDGNRSSRSASLVTNDEKPPIESVTAATDTAARDVPSSKGGKRKRPEFSAPELPICVRRSKRRQKMTSPQYVTGETRFVRESLLKIDDIIGDIESGKPTEVTISKLQGLKFGFDDFGALHVQADTEWSSDKADIEWGGE
ncbi:hypothetical protein V493_00445 [Pseudogymnoascus sp. VKM F-4281 (FW-2241)]|nr:hypothetical protein V493_00445 [Pseudogymnoascus sp. VKM F-4281 (FW-2241)]